MLVNTELHVSVAQLDECPGIPWLDLDEKKGTWDISLSHTVHDREMCFFFLFKFLKGYVGVGLCPS